MGKLGAAKIVIVRLQGGLGNQLFQYAAARGMANGRKLILDSSALGSQAKNTPDTTTRFFELSVFSTLKYSVLPAIALKVFTSENRFLRLVKKIFYPGLINIPECPVQQARELAARSKVIYLNGYFQDENFFVQIRRTLLKELSFPDPGNFSPVWLGRILSADNAVSIHVRRGDYLTPKALAFHGVLGPDYYQASVQLMNSRVPTPHYFIFSDDPDWCREHLDFPGDKSIMPPGQKAWVDLALMSKCRHNIIANSSFSWWAAWLNDNPEKIIIAPRKWFADEEVNSSQCTIIPDNWIKI
jgi:hypothetical protein